MKQNRSRKCQESNWGSEGQGKRLNNLSKYSCNNFQFLLFINLMYYSPSSITSISSSRIRVISENEVRFLIYDSKNYEKIITRTTTVN